LAETHNLPAAENFFLEVEDAFHGQTFNAQFGEVTADHLKRGITIVVPSLTDHPVMPNSGTIHLMLTFESDQWLFSTEFVDGIYKGEKMFIPPEQIRSFSGQRMAIDLLVYSKGVPLPSIMLFLFVELDFSNHMAQVAGAKHGFIDAHVAASGSVLFIPPYDGMSQGDEVVIYLLGRQSGGSHIFRVSVENSGVGQAINVPVPATLLQPSGNSTIMTFYRIVTAGHTLNGPLATFFVEGDSGVPIVADASFIEPHLISQLSHESKVVFTVPQALGQMAGADQTLFLWDEFEPTRRDYLLDTRSLDGPSKWSSDFFPGPDGGQVYTATWISMGADTIWASPIHKVMIGRIDPSLRTSMPCPSAISAQAAFEAPTVLEAIDGVVSEEAINAGLTVTAPRPAHLPNDSYLSLILRGYQWQGYSEGTRLTDDPMMRWSVPGEKASQLLNQVVSLHYVVQDGSGARSDDTLVDFAVQRPLLQVREAEQNNGDIPAISIEAAAAGVSVFLPPAPGLDAGDVVTLYWGGSAGKGHCVTSIPWTYEHQVNGLTFQIPPHSVTPHLGGQVVASYTVLALGRVLDGPVSRFLIQSKVEPVDVMPVTQVEPGQWLFRGQALITLSKRLRLGMGDKVIWYVDTSPKTASSIVAWRLEQVVSDPSQPIRVMIPDAVSTSHTFEVRIFVIRADNGDVSFTSIRLAKNQLMHS
jgi:hypothetical protein